MQVRLSGFFHGSFLSSWTWKYVMHSIDYCVVSEIQHGKSTINDIVKNEAKLQTFLTEIQDGHCIKKKRIIRDPDLEELDRAVCGSFGVPLQRC